MNKSRDFLLTRKDELVAQIEPLQDELECVVRALAAMDGKSRRGATIKDVIVNALTSEGEMTVSEVRRWAIANMGLTIDRTSLSPQMTRLRRDGIVKAIGKKWSIAQISN